MDKAGFTVRWVTCATLGLLSLAGCQRDDRLITPAEMAASMAASGFDTEPPASGPKRSTQLRYSLGIVGYNYTETGIIDYSVNGTGAFNLGVSNEHSGGGSTICCFGWAPGMKLPMPIRIEWTRDEATWCRKTVMLTDPGPLEPNTFEVHFYPDRHIEVAITDSYSPPRLILSAVGRDYRVVKNVQKEKADAMQKDSDTVECREGRFPIGGLTAPDNQDGKAKK